MNKLEEGLRYVIYLALKDEISMEQAEVAAYKAASVAAYKAASFSMEWIENALEAGYQFAAYGKPNTPIITFKLNWLRENNLLSSEQPKGHSFCEKPGHVCTMNYCDDNGCQERKRQYTERGTEKELHVNIGEVRDGDNIRIDANFETGKAHVSKMGIVGSDGLPNPPFETK